MKHKIQLRTSQKARRTFLANYEQEKIERYFKTACEAHRLPKEIQELNSFKIPSFYVKAFLSKGLVEESLLEKEELCSLPSDCVAEVILQTAKNSGLDDLEWEEIDNDTPTCAE